MVWHFFSLPRRLFIYFRWPASALLTVTTGMIMFAKPFPSICVLGRRRDNALRNSALAALFFSVHPSPPQEAANTLSVAASVDTSDTNAPYNAACGFALCGDEASCFRALTEYCRRLVVAATAAPSSAGGGRGEEEEGQEEEEEGEEEEVVGWRRRDVRCGMP